MKLLTETIRRQLLKNGANRREDKDYPPVCKFFNPTGAATWLISEMDPEEPDILFGLCDLGFGEPELGSVRLSELESVKGPLGLGIERDIHFTGEHPLSWYADRAREAGRITV